jgi:hypothetical protein
MGLWPYSFRIRVASICILKVRATHHGSMPRGALDAVELADVGHERDRLTLIGLDGLEHVAAKMRHEFDAGDAGPMIKDPWVHRSSVGLHDTSPAQREEAVEDFAPPVGRELQNERLLVRGVIAPKVGIVRATSAARGPGAW